jgi:hypothetical protein
MVDSGVLVLFSALGGAAIGALATIGTVYVQTRNQISIERLRTIRELAIADHSASVELIKARPNQRHKLAPLSVFVHFYFEVAHLIVDDSLTLEAMDKLREIRRERYGA